MKKLGLLVMPLMAVSFLLGCGGPTDYKFDFIGTNCSANNETSYKKDAEVIFTITADDGCLLPTTVNVDGTTAYQYNRNEDKVTATFSCTMPASEVKVTAEAKNGYTFTFAGDHCTANNEEIYEKDSKISIVITPDPFWMLPANLSSRAVTGIDEYEYTKDDTSGIATFSCTMTANVKMQVMATQDPAKTLNIVTADEKRPIPSSIEANQSLDIVAIKKGVVVVAAEFTSSDESILSITEEADNKVTIKGESGGSAIITCKAEGFATRTCKIEVIPLVMHIKQDNNESLPTSIYAEDKYYIAAYDNNNEKVQGAEFSTEDETITITKENERVKLTGVSEGYGKIVCKAKGYRDADFTIYVNDLKDMSIKLSTGEDVPSVIDVNETEEIAAYDGDIQLTSGVTFESLDSSIIQIVDTNKIKGIKAGTATITAKAIGYKEATCEVEVRETYNVTCSDTDFELSNLKATTDQDYKTTITLKAEKINQDYGYSVPNELTSVTVTGSGEITDYTYTPTENTFSAELVIPKANIIGDITISLEKKELTPLCFTANEGGASINFRTLGTIPTIGLLISNDNQNWIPWPDDDGPLDQDLKEGEKLYVKNATNTLSDPEGEFFFNLTGSVAVSGNVNSMVNYDALTPNCFEMLFFRCSEITSAPALPATTLKTSCYINMFEGCTSLTSAPALPATVLAEQCYRNMFIGCSGLTSAPFLPATTNNLARKCYESMFVNCSNLNYVKVGFDGGTTRIEWPEDKTKSWLEGVAAKGTFVWKGSALGPHTRDANTVPNGWTCVQYE